MPDFELRFVAVPEIKQDADKDLRKQWERRFQNQVVGKLAVDAEIPKQTLTKLRNQYAQIMNDLGKTTLDVGRDIAGLRQQYGKAFDMTGITDQFKSDLAKTGNTIESLTQAAEKHAAQVRQLESEYVNLKAKMREAAQTLEGEAKTTAIDELEAKIRDVGEQIKRTFGADELEHFNRTMGELGGKGSTQVVGIQEYADSISGLRTRIVELAGEGERLVRVFQEWDGKQWVDTSTQIQDRTQRLAQEFSKLGKQVDAFEKRYGLGDGVGAYAKRWEELRKKIEAFNVDAPDARENLEDINRTFMEIKGDVGGAGDKLSLYKRQLNEVVQAKLNLQRVRLDNAGAITSETRELESNISTLEREADATRESLNKTDKATQATNAKIDADRKLEAGINEVNKAWAKQNSIMSNVVGGFKEAAARIINYTTVYRLLWLGVAKFKESIQVAKDLNESFTSIQMVTLSTADATKELRREYADLAHEMSGTVTQVAAAADEWLRQGKTAQETTELIRASMVMSRIGAIESAEATTYLTSVLNGYKIATEDVMHVVDAMSQVDIESASSVDDLAVALQRSASTASQAGVSFERLLGYVATVREVTQRSASVVGESFKTIFSRLGSVKAGTFLSEDLESEYTDITTYANDVEKVLSKIGIRLRDTNKDFRDAQDVLDDVAKGWANYDDLTKQALATAIAGTRQRENFLALMENYDKALKLEESALNSNGKAMQKYQVYQDSIAAKQDRINALAQTWVQNMDFEWAIGQLLSLGEAFMKVFSDEAVVQQTKVIASVIAVAVAIKSFIKIAAAAKAAGGVLSLITGGGAAAGVVIGANTVIAAIVGITVAITALVAIIDKYHKSVNELRSDLQSLATEYDESVSKVETYNGELETNISRIQELQELVDKGVASIVDKEEIDALKEENEQLERQIALEKIRQENIKAEETRTAKQLYGKGFTYQRYMGAMTMSGDLKEGETLTGISPESVITIVEQDIRRMQAGYERAVDMGLVKLADAYSKAILEKQQELTDTIIPSLEQMAGIVDEEGNAIFQGVVDALEKYYNNAMSYADRIENIKVEYPDEYAEFGEIVAENSEAFQAYLDGDDEALNEFADILSGKASPAIYAMIVAMQQAGIPLAELIRLLLNAANTGEDLSNSIKLETPAAQIERFKDKVKSVVAAEEELAETGYVSADAAADLAEAYSDKVYDAMVWTSNGYKVNKESLEDLISSERTQYEIALSDAQNAAAAIVDANIDESASYKQKTADILDAIQAKKIELSLTARAGIHGKGPMSQEAQDAINALQELQKYEKEIAILQENLDNFDKTIEYLRGTSTSGKSKGETAYEREIRLLEHELYLSEQVADLYKGDNDEANYRAEVNKQLEIYLKLMEAAHAEAERLRKLGYAETSEEIQELQQAWWGYYNARRDLETGLADWEKETTKSALSDVKSAIDDLLDDAEDKLNEKLDDLEYRIKKNEAIKALHEAFFGILNDVADGLHEIDKELESSLSSVDYLDESLRNAMFNEVIR